MLLGGGKVFFSRPVIPILTLSASCCGILLRPDYTSATISFTGILFGVGANFSHLFITCTCVSLSSLDERLMIHFLSIGDVISWWSRVRQTKASNCFFWISFTFFFLFSIAIRWLGILYKKILFGWIYYTKRLLMSTKPSQTGIYLQIHFMDIGISHFLIQFAVIRKLQLSFSSHQW